ncbi:MAG: exonuclease SbcCD subunit D [Chloroflexi bacterium]|nr:exonuclease SbcCD subunit D [Chloroflexota bacterium]
MTDPIRVLHFADVHIGMETYGNTDPEIGVSSRVRDFLRRLDEVVDYARDYDADLVVFAGDAFKSRNPTPTFQREFAFRIQDLAKQCPVVMLVGNHDLASIERRASSIEIYETLNVPNTILGREYRTQQVETKRGPVLLGLAPYPARHHLLRGVEIPHNKTIAEIDAILEDHLNTRLEQLAEEASHYDMPRLLVGHFSVSGASFGSERSVMLGRDAVVLLSTLDHPAWDYVALGHIHKHQCLTLGRAGAPPVVYSGSIERIDFGEESDQKGFVWVELTRGRAQWEFIPVQSRPFATLRIDVRTSGDPTRMVIQQIARHDLRDAVVRVIITADSETDLLIQDRMIQQALHDAQAYHIAAIVRQVERPARLRLGMSPEGLDVDQLLERYLLTKEIPSDRIDVLLDHARHIFTMED